MLGWALLVLVFALVDAKKHPSDRLAYSFIPGSVINAALINMYIY